MSGEPLSLEHNDHLRRELEVATAVAHQAGEILLSFFREELSIQRKDGGEPVTEADQRSEELVVSTLRSNFPLDGVLSEEAPEHQGWTEYKRVWIVDPMDGTRDFIHGREGFSVMIGLLTDSRPTLGVVYQPTAQLTYRGIVGIGAETIDKQGHIRALQPQPTSESSQLRLVSSYSHHSEKLGAIKATLGIRDEVSIGSVGLKTGLIARGERDLYINPEGHCKLWDVCAPEAILIAAGGRMTDLYGKPIVYDDPQRLRVDRGIVASNGPAHDQVLALLEPFRSQV